MHVHVAHPTRGDFPARGRRILWKHCQVHSRHRATTATDTSFAELGEGLLECDGAVEHKCVLLAVCVGAEVAEPLKLEAVPGLGGCHMWGHEVLHGCRVFALEQHVVYPHLCRRRLHARSRLRHPAQHALGRLLASRLQVSHHVHLGDATGRVLLKSRAFDNIGIPARASAEWGSVSCSSTGGA
eukprot:366388-Chlamydomonas_euryale.AAC.8